MKLINRRLFRKENIGVASVSPYILFAAMLSIFLLDFNYFSLAVSPANEKISGIFRYLPAEYSFLRAEKNEGKLEFDMGSNYLSNFEIIHSHNFDNNTLGNYSRDEKIRDWGILKYDNRPGFPQIVSFDGSKRAKHFYLKGTNRGRNGSDFGAVIIKPSDEVYYSFRMYYEPGFDFFVSGKLPGFRMWPAIEPGYSSNSVKRENKGSVVYLQVDWQGRLNWNVYHHQMTTDSGERMGVPFNFYTIKPGNWIDVTYRIVLNTPGIANGILQIWINGELKNTATGVLLRTKTSVQDLNQQVIFTAMDWIIPVRRDQSMYMDDFYIWKYSAGYLVKYPSLARGFKLHGSSHNLITPLGENGIDILKYNVNSLSSPMQGGKITLKSLENN